MIKRYVSKYTGQQIDEAVKAIQNASYQVGLEDLTPELISEIKKWIAEGSGGTSGEKTELKFKNHNEFPNIGTEGLLYIAGEILGEENFNDLRKTFKKIEKGV